MNSDFPRIITLLRKERGVSQKKAAADLGISQALLSHYEKGIRECGLEFLVKTADYYNVSCDYLLGRSPEPAGKTISYEDIHERKGKNGSRRSNGGVQQKACCERGNGAVLACKENRKPRDFKGSFRLSHACGL